MMSPLNGRPVEFSNNHFTTVKWEFPEELSAEFKVYPELRKLCQYKVPEIESIDSKLSPSDFLIKYKNGSFASKGSK